MSLDYGPQYHPPELIEWNLLGSKSQVEQSAAGTNLSITGTPTYNAGVFGGCFNTAAVGNRVNRFCLANDWWPNASAIEFFVRPNGYNIVNGVTSDAASHAALGWYRADNQFLIVYWGAAGMAYSWRTAAGVIYGPINVPCVGMNAVSGAWHHTALVWNVAGIGGGPNTHRVYWDNVALYSSNAAIIMPTTLDGDTMVFGAQEWGVGAFIGGLSGAMDNFKQWNYAKTDFADSIAAEGFTPPTPAPGPYPAEPLTGRRTTAELGGIDLTCRIIDVSNITTERSISSDMVFAASAEIKVLNFDEAFCLESTGSIIDATSPVTQDITIRDKWGDEIWRGLLSSVEMNYEDKTATLRSRSPLYAFRETPVIYAGGPVTPAAALIGVSSVIGFTEYLDLPRAAAADATQTAAGLTLTFTLVAADNMTFGQFIAKCCDYGCADVIDCDGKIVYHHLKPFDPARPAIDLTECDLLDQPKISREADVINDYAIYEAGTATVVTDAAQGNLGASSRLHNGTQVLKSIPSVATPAFAITNVAAARYLGECWMHVRHFDLLHAARPRTQIEITLTADHCTWIKAAQDFTLTFAREGWIQKPFRMTRWVRSESKKTISVTAIEWEV